jgi:hypothetical protein
MAGLTSKTVGALFPLLTAALLATACSVSMAPSTGANGPDLRSPTARLPGGLAEQLSRLTVGPVGTPRPRIF